MPIYDYCCGTCGKEYIDVYESAVTETMPCQVEGCGGTCTHLWRPGHVIGDEIDVTIQHGMCNPDGSPRRYTSRSELRREEQRRGLSNHVEHKPPPGTDKSKHTQRWI